MRYPEPDRRVTMNGRSIAVDDRGDPDGTPVLYVHGTPDSRLARHPVDGIARRLGIRLIAADRPGIGDSDPDPEATPMSVADDLTAVLEALGVPDAHVVAWSAGSITALALAATHPDRVRTLTLVAPLIPADAYGDADVLAGSDDSRKLFADHLGSATPDELGRELAPWLVPPEIDDATAREMLADSLAAVRHIDGAGDQLVAALCQSVAAGTIGLEREIAAQATPLGDLLDTIAAPVTIHVGDRDEVTPPPMGRWLADRLGTDVRSHAGEGHALMLTRWEALLTEVVSGGSRAG